MPYHVEINLQSPYHPRNPKVLDYPEDWFGPKERKGKFYQGNKIYIGSPLDPESVPHRYSVGIPADRLPDMFDLPAGPMVSDILRDKIKELEPGVHRFFSAEITGKGGQKPAKRYWLFQICNLVNAIDDSKSTLYTDNEGRSYFRWGVAEGVEPNLVFHKDAIEGMCVWMDERFPGFCFSDELFEFVEERKLTKLDSWKVFAE